MSQAKPKVMKTIWEDLTIFRMPEDSDPNLQGWDGADLYILEHLNERGFSLKPDISINICILNDAHGALSSALRYYKRDVIIDSYCGTKSFERNQSIHEDAANTANIIDISDLNSDLRYDIVLIKVPKSHSLLKHQLAKLALCLKLDSIVIGAGLTRHIHKNTIKIFETSIGPTPTSLAKYKSRLLLPNHVSNEAGKQPTQNDSKIPSIWSYEGLQIANYPGVFSENQLDQGSRVLLECLKGSLKAGVVIDLGCGNGVLSAFYSKQLQSHGKTSQVYAIDDSKQAIKSASHTFMLNKIENTTCILGDGLKEQPSHSADVILLNPPFHEGHGQNFNMATKMLKDARRVLKEDGVLWLVGNRHLKYHQRLKPYFSKMKQVGPHPKFVVFKCSK